MGNDIPGLDTTTPITLSVKEFRSLDSVLVFLPGAHVRICIETRLFTMCISVGGQN